MVTTHSPGGLAREVGDAVLDIADRAHRSKRGEDIAQSFPVHVRVAIDKARNDGLAFEVDDPRPWARVRGHRVVRADGDDSAPCDGHRLGDGEGRIDRDDLAVPENGVGWRDEWNCRDPRGAVWCAGRMAAEVPDYGGSAGRCQKATASD
jgi:hypothetical protein